MNVLIKDLLRSHFCISLENHHLYMSVIPSRSRRRSEKDQRRIRGLRSKWTLKPGTLKPESQNVLLFTCCSICLLIHPGVFLRSSRDDQRSSESSVGSGGRKDGGWKSSGTKKDYNITLRHFCVLCLNFHHLRCFYPNRQRSLTNRNSSREWADLQRKAV